MEQVEEDVIKTILESVEKQAKSIADKIGELEVQVGAVSSEDKSFEHFMKWATDSVKVAENIQRLRTLANGNQESEGEAKPSSGNPAEDFVRNRK